MLIKVSNEIRDHFILNERLAVRPKARAQVLTLTFVVHHFELHQGDETKCTFSQAGSLLQE